MINLAYGLFMTGAAAIAVPVILHLLRRRPTDEEAFPSFMFLGASAAKAHTRNSLRKWIILLLRALTILAIALAFSWPYIASFDEQPDEGTVVLWDSSLSMRASPYAEEMKAKAREALAKAAPKTPVLAGVVGRKVSWSGKFSSDPGALKAWFDANAESSGSSSFSYALSIADARLKDIPAAKRKIVVLTDKQAVPWKDLPLEPAVSKDTELAVLTPKTPGFKNVAVTKARACSTFTEGAAQVGVETEISNYSPDSLQAELSIFVEGSKAEARKISLKPFESSSFRFAVKPPSLAPLACRAEVSANDDLPQDNVRHFALNPGEAPLVLATPPPSGREDFIKIAFAPGEAARAADFKTAKGPELKDLFQKASLVVLREGSLGADSEAALQRHLQGGGTAVALWRDNADMRSLLLRFGVKTSPALKRSVASFGEIDFEDPIFKKFMEAKIGGLFDLRFFNPGTLTPPADAKVIASFKDGRPAIFELPCGKGRLVVLAFQMERSSTDWPTAPSFLPFWRELLASSRQKDAEGKGQDALEALAGAQTSLRAADGKALDISKPGCFKVSFEGRQLYASVNSPAEESNPAALSAAYDFKKLLGKEDSSGIEASSSAKLASLSALGEKGTPLWRPLLLLALLLALCEMALANRTAL